MIAVANGIMLGQCHTGLPRLGGGRYLGRSGQWCLAVALLVGAHLILARPGMSQHTGLGGASKSPEARVPACKEITLDHYLVSFAVALEVCDTIRIGPGVSIEGAKGHLKLTAGFLVVFENGVVVGRGARLQVGIDRSLLRSGMRTGTKTVQPSRRLPPGSKRGYAGS